jgi:putative glutamine amidotransferase
MTPPLIGITTSHFTTTTPLLADGVNEAYIKAVQRAGGLPVLIPLVLTEVQLDDLASRLDGLLFTGGGDIDPARYDGLAHVAVYDIDQPRDDTEIYLVQRASRTGQPFLGICRGIQVINVALGGSLYSHIADQKADALKHDYYPGYPRGHHAHPVQVSADSRLAQILGTAQVEVNSLHHQGLENIAPSLKVTAYAPDQLVEAVELAGHPFGLGVQWHPEWLQEAPEMRALFSALVGAAARP